MFTTVQKAESRTIIIKPMPIQSVFNSVNIIFLAFVFNILHFFPCFISILTSIITGLQKDLVNRIGSPFREPITEQWYVGLFQLVIEKAGVLKPIFGAGFQAKYLELVNGILQRHKNMATEEVYLRLFWCGGIVNAVIYWLSHGLKESSEEMAVICHKFLYYYNEPTCIKDERFHG